MLKKVCLLITAFCLIATGCFAGDSAIKASPGVWDKTKDVTSDVWQGTKDVASDVWDGTKKVTSDVWDGTKEVGSDIKDGVTGDETPSNNTADHTSSKQAD